MIIVGALEAMQAFWQPRWGGFFLHLIVGILAVVIGFDLVTSPEVGVLLLSLFMVVDFIAIGIIRSVVAIVMRLPNWNWVLLSGFISINLGVLIKEQWPHTGLRVIGLFIGIDFLFNGWSYLMLFVAAANR